MSQEEYDKELKIISDRMNENEVEVENALARGHRRAKSFNVEIYELFMEYNDIVSRLHKAMHGISKEGQDAMWIEMVEKGAELQIAIRDYLLSV